MNYINTILLCFYILFTKQTELKQTDVNPVNTVDTTSIKCDTLPTTLIPIESKSNKSKSNEKQVKNETIAKIKSLKRVPTNVIIVPTNVSDTVSNDSTTATFYQQGIASYYAHKYNGRKTASGEVYNMNSLTAAHFRLPFGTRVKVTNLINNKFVIVRINDKGPFPAKSNGNAVTDKKAHKTRIIDLSLAAMKEIDAVKNGHVPVKLEVL
jgi:rare lipoprotein A